MKFFRPLIYFTLLIICSSCALFGIHYNVHNPNKPGKIPAFTQEQILLGEMTTLRSCFDVKYYDLSVQINPSKKSLSGSVQILSTAVTDFESFQIDLHSNMEITSLRDMETGKELEYSRIERAIIVELTKLEGENFEIQVDYYGKPIEAKKPPWKGGFAWEKDKNKKPWVGVACESDGASIWWPLKDHTSDEPDSIRMHYSVPNSVMAVGNGQYEGKEENSDYTTYNWFVSYPINTYNVSVYLGDFVKFTDYFEGVNGQEMNLDYFVLPENLEKAKKHFTQVTPILNLYEEKFGEYPWYRDGFKLVESCYEGMEHQTAIAYGNGYENFVDSATDYIILHEIAHEWWGNSVTAYDLSDVWIQEGFATYAEALYMESRGGNSAYRDELFWSRLSIKNKYSVIGVEGRRWFDSNKNSDVYGKGAWILHTLRIQMDNDSLFFDIIKEFYETNAYRVIRSEDFEKLVNQKTKSDYTWFFDQYLRNNYAPELEYKFTLYGSILYRWKHVNASFNKLVIKAKINGEVYTMLPTNTTQEIKYKPNGKSDSGTYTYSIGTNNVFCAFKKNNKLRVNKSHLETF